MVEENRGKRHILSTDGKPREVELLGGGEQSERRQSPLASLG